MPGLIGLMAGDTSGSVLAMGGGFANNCEWHFISASTQEIEGVCAEPHALYSFCGDVVQSELRLSERSAVVIHGGMHWLLSEEIPGDSGPLTPLVFLDRGGLEIELHTQLVFADNTRLNIESARYFLPHERQAIVDAISSLDQEARCPLASRRTRARSGATRSSASERARPWHSRKTSWGRVT